jgi:nitroimidazol reductase NimA-like FMN-containing flavoprotein (pyridoxamine 5'-phosphate oxidase superfamily)
MRKQDRAVTDHAQIIEILENNDVCRVALQDDEGLYIVPLNYGYEFESGNLYLYLHGAKEGRKVNTFKKGNVEVAFEIDEKNEMKGSGDNACTYTYLYKSIIGNGIASVVEGSDNKEKALRLLMFNIIKKDDFKFSKQSIDNVLVMKISVTTFSAKKH